MKDSEIIYLSQVNIAPRHNRSEKSKKPQGKTPKLESGLGDVAGV